MLKMQRMSNNNRNVEYKEGTNLLDAGSSDSELEQFSLPQTLNLKGSKKKSKKLRDGPVGCCSLGTSMLVLGLVILTAIVAALGAYTYKLSLDLQDLKSKSGDAQGSREGSVKEIIDIKKQLSDQKKSLEEFKKGENGLDKVQGIVSDLKKQVAALNATSKTLTQSLAEAPKLASLPDTVASLSSNVASMGSDITGLQGKVEELELFKSQSLSNVESLTQKINAIDERAPISPEKVTEKVTEPTSPAPTPVDNTAATQALEKYVTQSINRFDQDLAAMNLSVFHIRSTNNVILEEMKQNSSLIGQRVSALEVKALTRTDAGDSGIDMDAIVRDVLEELKNATIDQRTEIDHNLLQQTEYKVSNVSAQVTRLTEKIQQIQGQAPSDDVVRVEEEFLKYTTTNEGNLEAMRNTLDQLTGKVKTIESELNIDSGSSEPKGDGGDDVGEGAQDIPTTPVPTPTEGAEHSSTTTTENPDDADMWGDVGDYPDYDDFERNYDNSNQTYNNYDTDADEQRKKRLVSDEEVKDLLNGL